MIFPENRFPSPIGVEDMLFGIMLDSASKSAFTRVCDALWTHANALLGASQYLRNSPTSLPCTRTRFGGRMRTS
jgi:hypothetical protein